MRYVESLSSYARQFLGQMSKPDVDAIEGLSPAISIEQKTTSILQTSITTERNLGTRLGFKDQVETIKDRRVERFMYQIGELVIYGSHGVCKVEAVGIPNISWVEKGKIYYTLRPAYQEGTILTPVDTSVFMRPVITYTEAQRLISLIPSIREDVYENSNLKLLENHYQESLQTHDCTDLIKVIKTVYTKKVIAEGRKKKLGKIDERFMKKAEDLLYGELAVALKIPKDTVKSYIEDRVKELENKAAIE